MERNEFERREFERLMRENIASQYLSSQNFLVPENHHYSARQSAIENHLDYSAGISTVGNYVPRLPALQEDHPFPLLQPNVNPYGRLMNTNVQLNPSFSDNPNDFSLEAKFERLGLSAPHPSTLTSSSPYVGGTVGGLGGSIGNGSLLDLSPGMGYGYSPYSPTQFSNGDLQRMRVQAATRGQMGLYMQPQNNSTVADEGLESFAVHRLDSNAIQNYEFSDMYSRGSGAAIRLPAQSRPHRNGLWSPYRTGYCNQPNLNRRLDTDIQYWGTPVNGIESYNSDTLMPSLYNGSLHGSRQRQNFSSLNDLRGKIFLAAKDQYGCRFLQKKFEEGKPEDIQMIFFEIKDHARDLMVDQFGNYLIQKFFDVCNEEQMTQLLLLVLKDDRSLMAICVDMHGTRAMQKMLERLTTPRQKSLVISALTRITVTLTKSPNGHHVIQHCMKFFTTEDNKHMLNVLAEHCLDISTDKSGCCVMQQCVLRARGEPQERILAEITANVLVLSEHPYGNYVVQYVVGLGIRRVRAEIVERLAGHYVAFSLNKYGSNVVERCLRESDEDQVFQIIDEILASESFLTIAQDPYGNYVAQCALSITKGALRHQMVDIINANYAFLHSHPHGKRVLAAVRQSRHRI